VFEGDGFFLLDVSELDTPIAVEVGNPNPYIAATLGSIAAIAAIKLEFGFLGSKPKAVSVTGSIFKVLGSIPRAVSIAGSNFLGSIPRDDARMSWVFVLDVLTSGLNLSRSARDWATDDE
jgi:hypothetical protein